MKKHHKFQSISSNDILSNMEKEINKVEYDLNHIDKINRKRTIIKNLKIRFKYLQLVTPYVISAGIIASGFTLVGDIPFYGGDKFKTYAHIRTEFDNYDKVKSQKKYDELDGQNELSYYTNWKKEDNGFYSRIVTTYSIDDQSYEDILKLFDMENLEMEDVFGSPVSIIVEKENNLTDELLKKKPYIKAIIYNESKDDYIEREETVGENILVSATYVLLTLINCMAISKIREECFAFDLYDSIEKIKEEYSNINIDELQTKLEIKRDNYNRLIR